MKHLTTNEIRAMWIEFFSQKKHHIEETKSLIPIDDKSLLFINSGVATLKKYFDGSQTPVQNRLANSQKAIRTNDIENVGVTSRHHTLFEMLGNFSIGDYFKDEAIEFAFEILTDPKWFDIDVNLLYFTVHPNDHVAFNKWVSLGINPKHIVKLEENFWEIGQGPGGPNTEIFFDRGQQYDQRNVVDLLKDDLENDRIIEIWNIVFSQYNCNPGVVAQSDYEELPQKNIDTGMGLERMACIMQEVESNFETDNFMAIIRTLEQKTQILYTEQKMAYRVIADHIRALTFAIADGVLPANEGRGYVIRRILRRAVRFGYNDLNQKTPFLAELVDIVIAIMQDFYPYLLESADYIKQVVTIEEKKFFATLEDGLKLLNKEIEKLQGQTISGETAFKLYDTYGFPVELTLEVCQEKELLVDILGFNAMLDKQKQRAREAVKDNLAMSSQNPYLKQIDVISNFVGYNQNELHSKVVFITDLKTSYKHTTGLNDYYLILENTPFYALSGGQVADLGTINDLDVNQVLKLPNGQHIHHITTSSAIALGDEVVAKINVGHRMAVTANHSATHLLHYALHQVLGIHAKQAGSLQDDGKTRFDFSNLTEINKEDLITINNLVNELIIANHQVNKEEMSLKAARELGAEALFGEKYGDVVRVVKMGPSIELCGGTHVDQTKDIKVFQIISESGIGSGVRRIEATTCDNAVLYINDLYKQFDQLATKLIQDIEDGQVVNLIELTTLANKIKLIYQYDEEKIITFNKIITLNEQLKANNKQLESSNLKVLAQKLISLATKKDEITIIDTVVDNMEIKVAKILIDDLANELKDCIIILAIEFEDKVSVITKVAGTAIDTYNANDLLQEKISPFAGRGGGKPTMAQGGYQKQ